MIILVTLLLAVASVPLAGRDLRRLSTVQVRGIWIVVGAVVAQVAITSLFDDSLGDATARLLHLGTYAATGAFIVMNRHIRGVVVVGIGGGLNLIAITANGGVMPASAWASRVAGFTDRRGFQNSRVLAHARLQLFGDVLAIPHGWPVANVFSIGDLVLLIGAFVVLHCATAPVVPVSVPAVSAMSMSRSDDADSGERHRDAVQH